MRTEILPNGAFHSALVHLGPGDAFQSDSGAMFRASSNIDIDVTTRPKRGGGGGLLASPSQTTPNPPAPRRRTS